MCMHTFIYIDKYIHIIPTSKLLQDTPHCFDGDIKQCLCVVTVLSQ